MYPNLIEEVKQLDIPSHKSWLADAANITEEVLQDILDGTDQPTVEEAEAMARYLNCEFEYLFSEELSIVNMNDYDHRMLILLLEVKLLQLSEAGIIGVWDLDRFRRADALPRLIRRGEHIPYVELQGSIRYIDWMLRVSTSERERSAKRTRTKRMA